jgi:hypothetical protein
MLQGVTDSKDQDVMEFQLPLMYGIGHILIVAATQASWNLTLNGGIVTGEKVFLLVLTIFIPTTEMEACASASIQKRLAPVQRLEVYWRVHSNWNAA